MTRSIIRKIAVITLLALLITSVGFSPVDVSAAASPYLVLSSQVSYGKKVTVSWGKVTGAQKYVVHRSQPLKKYHYDKSKQKFKKVASLSGKNLSFKDKSLKYGYYYGYVVKAYKKKAGKWQLISQDYTCVYIGVMETGWDEYQWSDVPYSPKSVELDFNFYSSGMRPTGIVIERKTQGGKFKKLASIKVPKKKEPKYVDTAVKAGVKYFYRVRPYVKYKGKTRYGAYYSTIFSRTPANRTGQYDAVVVSNDAARHTMVIKLVSSKSNGRLVFDYDELLYQRVTDAGYDEDDGIGAGIVKYSTDGSTWSKYKKGKIVLNPGSTLYLQMNALIDKAFDTSGEFTLTDDNAICTYNDISCCSINFRFNGSEGHAAVGPNLEFWH